MWHARVFGLCGIAEKVSEDVTTDVTYLHRPFRRALARGHGAYRAQGREPRILRFPGTRA